MKYALLGLTAAAFLYVVYLAWLVDAASPQVVAVYIAASLGALVTSYAEPRWASGIKWAWVLLSFVTIAAIVSGPLDYLRLS